MDSKLPSANERPGDFAALLAREGFGAALEPRAPAAAAGLPPEEAQPHVHGTTIITVKFRDGVLNVADRRATAANYIMYDRAEKVVALDDHTLMSISGSYAKSLEVIRYLRTSYRYFERSQLQPMSLEGKLTEVSRLISGNVPNLMSGVGIFLPLISAYDLDRHCGRIFFFDALGARFEEDEYASAGSGSGRIQGIFDYILRTKGRFSEMDLDTALAEALMLLNVAARMDSATGGFAVHLPAAKYVTREGVEDISEDRLRPLCEQILRTAHGL